MRETPKLLENQSEPIFEDLNILDIGKWPVNDRCYIFNMDGSVGKIIKHQGLSVSGLTQEGIEDVILGLKNIIQAISGDDVTIQFIQRRRNKRDIDFDLEDKRLTKEMIARAQYVNTLSQAGELFEDEFYVAVNIHPDLSGETTFEMVKRYYRRIRSYLKKETPVDFINHAFEGINARISKIDSVVNSIKNGMIDNLKIKVDVVESREDNIQILRSFLAGSVRSRNEKFQIDPDGGESLRKNLYSGLKVEKEGRNYFVLDGDLNRVYHLDRFNPKVKADISNLTTILSAPFEFIYILNISKLNHKDASKKFNKEIIKSEVQESESFGRIDPVSKANTQNVVSAFNKWAESGEEAILMGASFIYKESFSSIEDKCEEDKITINEYLRSVDERLHNQYFGKLAQSEWISETMGHFLIYNKLLPTQSNLRSLFLSGMIEIPYSVCHLIPLYNEARTDIKHEGVNHFYTENKTLKTFNLFDPELASYMTLISGDMGSGKSVITQTILATLENSRLKDGSGKPPLIRVLDFAGNTGSFFKRARFLKKYGTSSHLSFNKGKKPNIQILHLGANKRLPNSSKLGEVVELLSKRIANKDQTEIKNSILDYYDFVGDEDGNIGLNEKNKYFKMAFGIYPESIEETKGDITNILSLTPGECIPNKDAMDSILAVMRIILSDDPQRASDDFNAYRKYFKREDVRIIIEKTYERIHDRFPYLRDVLRTFEIMNTHVDEDGNEKIEFNDAGNLFHSRVKDFTVDGSIRNFDRDSDIDLSADFILFDLYGLEKHPKLFGIYTIFLLQVVDNDMHKNYDRVRGFFMDETALALTCGKGVDTKLGEPIVQSILKMARTSRKHRYACVFASQLPTDFVLKNMDTPKILISQARTIIFCGFGDEDTIRETVNYYRLPAGSEKILRRLGIQKDRYSKKAKVFARFYMLQRKKDNTISAFILRNVLSPFEIINTASSIEENAVIEFYTDKKGMELEDVYEFMTQGRHIGDADLIQFLKENNYEQALRKIDV